MADAENRRWLVFGIPGLLALVIAVPLTIWRYHWEKSRYATTQGWFAVGNHMSFGLLLHYPDEDGFVWESGQLRPLGRFPAPKDATRVTVEYLRESPNHGRVKGLLPSRAMLALLVIDLSGFFLLIVGAIAGCRAAGKRPTPHS